MSSNSSAARGATFTDPDLAGARLGALLDAGPPCLLVLDDVWEAEQLDPLASGKPVMHPAGDDAGSRAPGRPGRFRAGGPDVR